MKHAATGLAAVLGLALGCGPSAPGGNGSGDDDDTSNPGGPDGAPPRFIDAAPIDPEVHPDAGNCGAQEEPIELINNGDPPDLLIVLDRSGSMLLAPGFPPFGTSKWDIMKMALTNLTAAKDKNINFGLAVYPTDDACGVVGPPVVGIGFDHGDEIASWLGGHFPDGNTPAHLALQAALTYYQSIPVNPAGRYVLFATDGIPNCGGNPPNVDIESNVETVAAVKALANAGIHTYVLGFGGLFGLDPQVLNDAAVEGREPRPGGPPHFYAADNAQQLHMVLDQIAGGIIVPSCTFSLASAPPDPMLVTVTADGVAVPRSTAHTNGWDYHPDASHITFFGSYCQKIESGAIANVGFVFGCPGPQVD
jgi:hypothetical protein